MSSVLNLINQRYTVKSFKKDLVDEGKVKTILDAGMDAPSKQNKYPYRMYVLDNRSEKANLLREKLIEYTSCEIDLAGQPSTFYQNEIRTAPLSVFVTIKPILEDWEGDQLNTRSSTLRSSRDAMMPTIFMLLQAQELGLGTACTGCFQNGIRNLDSLKKDFELDDDEFPFIVLNIGHAEEIDTEKTLDSIPYKVLKDGQIEYSNAMAYIDSDNPKKGVILKRNKGPTTKIQPENFLKTY